MGWTEMDKVIPALPDFCFQVWDLFKLTEDIFIYISEYYVTDDPVIIYKYYGDTRIGIITSV